MAEDLRNKNIFISAGEVSGDIHAADLMKAMIQQFPKVRFLGLGGSQMKLAGLESISQDVSYLSTIGFLDSLRFYKEKLNLFHKASAFILANRPLALILVDNQGFNIPLAKVGKKLKIPTFYYFPPHVSIWGEWEAPKLARIVDHLIVPHYADYLVYKKFAPRAFFSGNPLLDKIQNFKLNPKFFKNQKLDPQKKIVSILPGSRFQEIEKLLPIMLDAAKILIQQYSIQVLLPVSHAIFLPIIGKLLKEKGLENSIRVVKNDSYSVMAASEVNILSSGTASLESALFGKPAVICYQISKLSFFIGKLLVKKKMVGFSNIILDKKVFPELLQKDCSVGNILKETLIFLNMPKEKYSKHYEKIKKTMGEPHSTERSARFILEKINLGKA